MSDDDGVTMIGLLLLSSGIGLAAPLLMGFFAQRTLSDIFESPCRRSERFWAVLLAALATPLLLSWLALVPLQWHAFFAGKGGFEVLLPLALNGFCLAIGLPMLPRALRQRRIAACFDALTRASDLDRRYRYPARVERWMQGERSGYPVLAVPVDPVPSLGGLLRRRLLQHGDAFDFDYVRSAGLVVIARTRAVLPASLELLAAAGLGSVNRTRVFARPLPSSPRRVESGDPGFDRTVHVYVADADRPAAQRLAASAELRARLAEAFTARPLLYARASSGAKTTGLRGGRALDAPFDRPGFVAVQWIPMPRTAADVLQALDAVVRVAQNLDAVVSPAPTADEGAHAP